MDTGCEVVRARFLGGVELLHAIIASADYVVIGDDHTGDGGEENGVGGEVCDEALGTAEEVPGNMLCD